MAQSQSQQQRVSRQVKGGMEEMRNRVGAVSSGTNELVENAARRFQDMSMESYRFAQDAMEMNVNAMNRLIGCRSIAEMADVQRDFFKEAIDHAYAASRRVYGISAEMADEFTGTMTASLQEVNDDAKEAASGTSKRSA